MNQRTILPAVFLAAFIAPRAASAHGALSGLGAFYGGLLHSLIVPAELLAVLAVGSLLGRSGRPACRAGLIVFATGVTAGVLIARSIGATIDLTTSLPLGVGLVAGILVAAGIQVPTALASLVAMAAGMAIGIDAAPEAEALSPLLVASVATVLGSTLAVMLVAVLVLERNLHWQAVAVRVAASWIAACSILYFGWLIRSSAAP